MATVYYTASSLDGYIVDEADSLDWLILASIDADGPFGYDAFVESVGALVMGAATYEWILANHPAMAVLAAVVGADAPAARSSRAGIRCRPSTASRRAAPEAGVGGRGHRTSGWSAAGDAAAQFAAAGLIDEMIVSYAPCSLGRRRGCCRCASEWALVESGVNGDFVCARWRKG